MDVAAGTTRDLLVELIDGFDGPAAVLSASGDVVHVNQRLGRLLGRAPDEMGGVALGSTGDPLGRQMRPGVLNAARTGHACTIDLVGPAMGMPDLERHFTIRLIPIRVEPGAAPPFVVAIGLTVDTPGAEDVTSRLLSQMEALLAISRALMAANSVDEGLGQLAALARPHLADIVLAYLFEPLLGHRGLVALSAPDTAEAGRIANQFASWAPDPDSSTWRPVVEGGEALIFTPRSVDVASDLLPIDTWTSVLVTPIRAYQRDRTLGALLYVMDPSSREHDGTALGITSEIALRVSLWLRNHVLFSRVQERAHAAGALNHISDGVMLVADDDTIVLFNPAAESITGLPAASLIGRRVQDAFPQWSSFCNTIPVVTGAEQVGRVERVRLLEGAGEVAIRGSHYDEGTVYTFRNIADERRVEALKSDFVATVSHELRTPLASVYGAAATLRRGDIDLQPSMREELLDLILQQSQRLSDMVSNILTVSVADSDAFEVNLVPVDVGAMLRDVVGEFGRIAPAFGFSIDVEDGLPDAYADADKLRQVVTNLIENAVKYSPGGGAIAVAASVRGSGLGVSVTDQGVGIPRENQERVFDRFYRVDPGQLDGVSGAGLGLYICKRFIQGMNGSIDVESTPGKGSTFRFEVPAATP